MDLNRVYIEFIIMSGVTNFSTQVKESTDKSRKNIYSVMYNMGFKLEKEILNVSTLTEPYRPA